jgi:hypothetical protein
MIEAQAAVEIQQAIESAIPPEFLQIVSEAFAMAQQMQPQQPQDPTQAAAAVQRESIAQRAQSDQMKIQAQGQRDQIQAQTQAQRDAVKASLQLRQDELDLQTELLKQDREDARKQADLTARLQMNQEDNATAKDLAAAEILSGNKVDVSTGTGINPNPNF